MPKPRDTEAGVRNTQSFRVGIDMPRFRGMNRNADAGAISNEEFWTLVNIRLSGDGPITSRPGLEPVLDSALDGCVVGIFDDRNPSEAFGFFWTL